MDVNKLHSSIAQKESDGLKCQNHVEMLSMTLKLFHSLIHRNFDSIGHQMPTLGDFQEFASSMWNVSSGKLSRESFTREAERFLNL